MKKTITSLNNYPALQNYKNNFEYTSNNYAESLKCLLGAGWELISEKQNGLLLRRPGKNKGISGLLNRNGIFTCFTTNSDLPSKPNTQGFSTYELVRHYCFNNDNKATFNYFNQSRPASQINDYSKFKSQQTAKKQEPKQYELNKDYSFEFLYNFADYELTERAGIYQFDCGLSRFESEQLVISEFPNCQRERAYRVCINKHVINKNCDHTGKPLQNYNLLTSKFENRYLTLNEIGEAVTQGFSQCYCLLKENEGKIHRCSFNFIESDILALDIDSNLSIDEFLNNTHSGAIGVYTSYNHTQNANRFRVLFELPCVIKSPDLFKEFATKMINEYDSDQACKDPARAFYGANNGYFINLTTGDVIIGKECKLWN